MRFAGSEIFGMLESEVEVGEGKVRGVRSSLVEWSGPCVAILGVTSTSRLESSSCARSTMSEQREDKFQDWDLFLGIIHF